MDWQPIETAPRDAKILLFVPKGKFNCRTQDFDDVMVAAEWGNPGEWYVNATVSCYIRGATHWMPLPAAPQ